MEATLVESLSTGRGRAMLDALPPYDEAGAAALQTRLRAAGHLPELVAAVLAQSRLRARARPRLGAVADRLLLTTDGLEQATRPVVAAGHAARLASAGAGHVDDWGCGLGLDALAVLDAGLDVTGVEADPVVAAMARANLAGVAGPAGRRAEVVTGLVEDLVGRLPADLTGRAAWFDPARRVARQGDARGRTRRVGGLKEISPAWDLVQEVAGRYPAAGAKLAPGFRPAWLPEGCEGVWTSVGRAVVECAVWWGEAVQRPGPGALILPTGGGPGSDTATGPMVVRAGTTVPADGVGNAAHSAPSLYDPDPAVLQAGLVGELEVATGGGELDPGVGYVVSGLAVDVPWARRFAVLDRLPLTRKVLRGYVREAGWTGVVVKARGTSADVESLRRDLRPRQVRGRRTHEGTLVVTTEGGRSVVLVVSPTGRG